MPIVSESGDIQGNLSISIQQCTGIGSVTVTVLFYSFTLLIPIKPQSVGTDQLLDCIRR